LYLNFFLLFFFIPGVCFGFNNNSNLKIKLVSLKKGLMLAQNPYMGSGKKHPSRPASKFRETPRIPNHSSFHRQPPFRSIRKNRIPEPPLLVRMFNNFDRNRNLLLESEEINNMPFKLKDCFLSFDKNEDGKVEKLEFSNYLLEQNKKVLENRVVGFYKRMGWSSKGNIRTEQVNNMPVNSNIKDYFVSFDKNLDGLIDEAEHEAMRPHIRKLAFKNNLKIALMLYKKPLKNGFDRKDTIVNLIFFILDQNSDGIVSEEELVFYLIETFGAKTTKLIIDHEKKHQEKKHQDLISTRDLNNPKETKKQKKLLKKKLSQKSTETKAHANDSKLQVSAMKEKNENKNLQASNTIVVAGNKTDNSAVTQKKDFEESEKLSKKTKSKEIKNIRQNDQEKTTSKSFIIYDQTKSSLEEKNEKEKLEEDLFRMISEGSSEGENW
jgi:Ca2+-binding EF-hand superfamily protein